MNLMAHLLLAVLMAWAAVRGAPSPTPYWLLHSPIYVIAMVAAVIPDLDHVHLLGKAARTGRFGPESRSLFHEMPGLLIYSSAALALLPLGDAYFRAFLAGASSHFFLDYVSRPVRPLFPLSRERIFYYLAPVGDLRMLTIYDVGFTGIMLSLWFLLSYGWLPFIVFLTISVPILVYSLRGLEAPREAAGGGGISYSKASTWAKGAFRKGVEPVIRRLAFLGPSRISGLSLLLSMLPFALVAFHHILWALIAVIAVLSLDSLDGAIASYLGLEGRRGWIEDVAADRVSEAVILTALPWPFAVLLPINVALVLASYRWRRHVILPLRHIVGFYLFLLLCVGH